MELIHRRGRDSGQHVAKVDDVDNFDIVKDILVKDEKDEHEYLGIEQMPTVAPGTADNGVRADVESGVRPLQIQRRVSRDRCGGTRPWPGRSVCRARQ